MNDKINDSSETGSQRSCAGCTFSHGITSVDPHGNPIIGAVTLVCMRRPPQCFIRSTKGPLGEVHGVVTQFPPVSGEMFCYDFWPEHTPPPSQDLMDLITGETISD